MALVSGISLDPEAAIGVTKKLPPKWIEGVDEVETEETGTETYVKTRESTFTLHLCSIIYKPYI